MKTLPSLFAHRVPFVVLASLLLISCGDKASKQSKGFFLPEGDVETGKTTFVGMQCNRCHTVEGVMLPDHDLPELPKIRLGGEIYKVKSYGDLVTAIINPQHTLAPQYLAMLSDEEKKAGTSGSPMLEFNRSMTVNQLIDLVAFLHSRYKLIDPVVNEYFYVAP